MPNELYNEHSLGYRKDADGSVTTTGSFSYWVDNPLDAPKVGGSFTPVEGGPSLVITSVDVSDSVIGKYRDRLRRVWKVSLSGDTMDEESKIDTTYQFAIDKQESGLQMLSGSINAGNFGSAPIFSYNIGDELTIPGLNKTGKCTNISGGSQYINSNSSKAVDGKLCRWNMTYSFAGAYTEYEEDKTDKFLSASFGLNGVTARAVDGEFVVLRRSSTPIEQRSLTRYKKDGEFTPITSIGAQYPANSGFYVTSERIVKEEIKVGGVLIETLYRHDIEVEK